LYKKFTNEYNVLHENTQDMLYCTMHLQQNANLTSWTYTILISSILGFLPFIFSFSAVGKDLPVLVFRKNKLKRVPGRAPNYFSI